MRDGLLWAQGLNLVDEGESHTVGEWPGKQIIKFRLHHDDVQRDVGVPPTPIAIEVRPEAHSVPVLAGVERRAVQGEGVAQFSLVLSASEVVDLPHILPRTGLDLQDLQLQVQLVEDGLVASHRGGDFVHVTGHLRDRPLLLFHVRHKLRGYVVKLSQLPLNL